jgi:hypothetical protein
MTRFKRFAPRMLALLFLLSLTVGFRSFLMAYLIEPAALFFWVVWRIAASVDQNVYWALLIVLGFFPIIRLLQSASNLTHGSTYQQETPPRGRVEHWRKQIEEGATGRRGHDSLRKSLRALSSDLLAQSGIEMAPDRGGAGNPLHTPINARVFQLLWDNGAAAGGFQASVSSRASRWFRNLASALRRPDYGWVDETLTWMETELDIHDEN